MPESDSLQSFQKTLSVGGNSSHIARRGGGLPDQEIVHARMLNRKNKISSCCFTTIMPFRHISDDLKLAALRIHLDKGWESDEVAELLGFSERSLFCWKARFLESGELHLPQNP